MILFKSKEELHYKNKKTERKRVDVKDILRSLRRRDKSDKNRSRRQGKLEKTKESRLINTTRLSITECFLKVRKIIDKSKVDGETTLRKKITEYIAKS